MLDLISAEILMMFWKTLSRRTQGPPGSSDESATWEAEVVSGVEVVFQEHSVV
jgi:hypothetical protein